jgi:effector-binding domain-containing protein/uncharacterized protein YndB with AHSA1/START domain
MKLWRTLLVFLAFFVVAWGIMSLVVPTKQKVERTVTIHASASEVYAKLSNVDELEKWWVWKRADSSADVELSEQEPGKRIVYKIHFLKPKEREAKSTFLIAESNGLTSVTWNFEMFVPRPWNVFNLFSSLDKEKGKDFDEGLAALKKLTDHNGVDTTRREFEVERIDFPATSFAMIRQVVKWSDMSSFFQQHIPLLYQETTSKNIVAGTASGLFFEWNEKDQNADMAAAVPVPAGTKIESDIITVTDIPASKALYVNYKGTYDRMQDAYESIRQYMKENELKQKGPSIEQYTTGPLMEKDSTRWVTKIVFLIE